MTSLRLLVVLLPALLLGVVNGDCGSGVSGVLSGNVCCAEECGDTCGGTGCSSLPGGANSCCSTDVSSAGVSCASTGAGPCVMDSDVDSDGDEPADECSNGLAGIESDDGEACCPIECGETCGGAGCKGFGGGESAGLGSSSCCVGIILEEGSLCSDTESAPCIIGSSEPSPSPPSPTPTSSEPSPSPPSPTPTSNPSPTQLMTIPIICDSSTPMSAFSFDSEEGTTGTYYADGGCFTLTDLYEFQGTAGPLYVLDENNDVVQDPDDITGKWLLTADLHAIGGGTFYCRGSELEGGDCDELRIESTGPSNFHMISGHGGNLYFESTLLTSWDTDNQEPQTTYEGGRSFINCVSESGNYCANYDMGECRMDIINSEMGYLGWPDGESYGISWKVKGLCNDEPDYQLFEDVNVYGDMKGSDIHHNYYGHYSYGHQGGVWTDNLMHDNVQYGFDPHDDSDYLTISGNTVYNNGNHGIIASKRCNNVLITGNHVSNGGEDAHGIMLHRSSGDSEISNNVIENMQGSGIAIMESSNIQISGNTVDGAKYGVRLTMGSSDNQVYDNEFDGISGAGIYLYTGTEEVQVNDGRLRNNVFSDNVFNVESQGIKLINSDDTMVTENTFTGSTKIEFTDSDDTVWLQNSLSSGSCILDDSTFAESSELPDGCE